LRVSGADVCLGVARSNRGRFKQPLGSTSHQKRRTAWANRAWSDSLRRQGVQGGPLQRACRPQPRGELQVSARMVGTCLRAPTVDAPVISDASTQAELVTKETSVQSAACSECPDTSPGALVSACTR